MASYRVLSAGAAITNNRSQKAQRNHQMRMPNGKQLPRTSRQLRDAHEATLRDADRRGKDRQGPAKVSLVWTSPRDKSGLGKESNVEIRVKQEYSWEGHPQPLRPPYLEAGYHCPDDAQVSASSLAAD